MRELSISEIQDVSGGLWSELLIVAIQVGAYFLTSSGSSGSSATAANGANVTCADGETATATATEASCK